MIIIRRPLVLGVIVLLLAVGIYWATFRDSRNTLEPEDNTTGKPPVSLAPPTEQEKQETEAYKKQLAEPEDTALSSSQKTQVTLVISNANTDRVSAYVSGVLEDGGICTATFTKGGQTVTRVSSGFKNVSYTNCEPIDPGSQISGTGWSVVVSYNSPTAEGTSKAAPVEVKP